MELVVFNFFNMKIKYLITSLTLLFSFCAAASDESYISNGNAIYPYCSSSQLSTQMLCGSYVIGVVVGTKSQAAIDKSRPYFCIPEQVTHGQYVEVFTKYLADHPELRHYDTATLIFKSLNEAFPCSKRPPISSFDKK
ncbi:Rap1a/Tai family immunity protein [Massilia phyllosphaerae]|uniref:Rap1a/Tai family immunity protein n=1 Tax=Massilia phyllosphaerae TaxID=3106034 RepID=UPI002B1CD388|nr:Rap1a/Tai family immunity protein [Massilia sp. SGZ-792]